MLLKSLLNLVTENTPCRIDIRVEADGVRSEVVAGISGRGSRSLLTEALIRDSFILPDSLLLDELKWAFEEYGEV